MQDDRTLMDESKVNPDDRAADAWRQLRRMLKDVLAELGGGEAYLRAERDEFSTQLWG